MFGSDNIITIAIIRKRFRLIFFLIQVSALYQQNVINYTGSVKTSPEYITTKANLYNQIRENNATTNFDCIVKILVPTHSYIYYTKLHAHCTRNK